MQELTLELEFEIYKELHKITILQARLTQYYYSLQNTGVTVPFFMQEPPEKRAAKDIENLLTDNIEEFERLYNHAWGEVAALLP